ncbi:MAG: hypothetical protein LKF52_13590 [Butyrivibrio sp.]|jgi:flagellar hook-associated protein 3 FlgL|nr:hypothetical protein [Butyrivibrio sp.]
MRITNRIVHNNSLYNININKTNEDTLNTMTSTGKKITRPSDDPVVAIRALRLRSNVSQLSQYYEKNSKDAKSWLQVTEDALSTVTSVLTDSSKQAVKGSNKYLELDDLTTIVTQMDSLSDEYYATGNVDYAGRYVFTGYRTDTSLTFDANTTKDYTGINDEFNASDVGTSNRVNGLYNITSTVSSTPETEAAITQTSVGRIRLSYSDLNETTTSGVSLKYRTPMTVPATTSLATDATNKVIALSFKTDSENISVNIPTDGNKVTLNGTTYSAEISDGSYKVTMTGTVTASLTVSAAGVVSGLSGAVKSASANISAETISTVSFETGAGADSIKVPVTGAADQPYTMSINSTKGNAYAVTVNTDGTYTLTSGTTGTYNVIQLTANGSAHASYQETTVDIAADHMITSKTSEADIDTIYNKLATGGSETDKCYLNTETGELLLGSNLKNKLSGLTDITNAKTIDVVYNKNQWASGDIRPENLFHCTSGGVVYNGGSSDHIMEYDVGYNQTVAVNTTADEVFTTGVKRDVDDLQSTLDRLKSLNTTLTTLKANLETASSTDKTNIQTQIDAAQKAYNYLREDMQTQFENKITSTQSALDQANVAVTENGTRSKRLDLVQSRLQSQTTTFKELQSDNEDADLAETATNLSTAELTYQAALMATSKIMKTSLMNYI